ncbi:MAG: alpha-E domain-containing protein [Acidimicrobiia bacterium]
MLSRHAEHLFWTGRYVERAADTARKLDVAYHGLLGEPVVAARRGWLDLLDALHQAEGYRAGHDVVDARTVMAFLVLEPSNPGAVVNCVARARENARSVREMVSIEVWESINTFWLELAGRDLARELGGQPYQLLGTVRRRCQEIVGTASETMPHDDGWRFMTLGAVLERAEMTGRLLEVSCAPFAQGDEELGFHAAVHLLKSASASEAFRRAHPAAMTVENVLGFLLLSPTFPRSVLFCLRTAERLLGELEPGVRPSRALRVLGRRRADLEFAEVVELVAGDLGAYLAAVQADVRRAADLVGVRYFRHTEEFSVFHSLAPLP